jgi:hypothetical protein
VANVKSIGVGEVPVDKVRSVKVIVTVSVNGCRGGNNTSANVNRSA